MPWGKDIPEEIFLNDVLPYANVDEKRDAWRKEFYDLCLPIVKDCKTPAEAAQKLNADLFKKLKRRILRRSGRPPNQSPKESIEQGKASCTGLSIVLSDACRACACRPGWSARRCGRTRRGNHTWVEIWDKDWHFTGACEPDPKGLDRGWFVGNAAQAKKDVARARHLRRELQEAHAAFPARLGDGASKTCPGGKRHRPLREDGRAPTRAPTAGRARPSCSKADSQRRRSTAERRRAAGRRSVASKPVRQGCR